MSTHFPVAIVGIGCRLPGGSDTKELYHEFLRNKGDGMTEPPPDRWDHSEWSTNRSDEPGKYNSAMGGFISDVDQFDTLEFGISVKEAQHLDPSSRLILEVAHQALLDSGLDYRGSNTGVYIGQLLISASELGNSDRYEVSSYHGLGKCVSLRSNRVSFTFDLRGPSMMLDTACSSSAMAMHMAINAMKVGEIDQALIIGGNVMVQPTHNVIFSKTGILSPTGSSKSFDAGADGYARAEGFGAVVVKRLDKALSDGDTVYSVITGSSINSNGKGVSLTMPKGEMQAKTIRQAYANAGRKPSDAFFVELHATGTPVGDPIEANTVGQIFSEERQADKFLKIGSVKANIGHTEGCSFLASLIKVSLMLKHKEIIPNIRFNKPNPKIDFEKWLMKVQTELEEITPEQAASDGKWVASVASSGIGGSNSHVVLETLESVTTVAASTITEPAASESQDNSDPLYLFVIGSLSGTTVMPWKDALTAAYQDVTDHQVLRSLSYDLARKSRSSPARSFAVGSTLSPDLTFTPPIAASSDAKPELCLVFSGQGPQHIAMGRGLCTSFPVFLSSVRECDEILVGRYGQQSFLERTGLFVPGEKAKLPAKEVWPIEEVVYSIVFMQIAQVDLIKSLGIEYHSVIGHSIGEIAMGYASGCYDKKTAVGIAAARAGAMAKLTNNGSMVALNACYHRAKYMIKSVLADAQETDGLWIAAINSPIEVTVAGDTKLIEKVYENAQGRKMFAAKLRVTCAFHTPLMEACEQDFRALAKLAFTESPKAPSIPTYSTVDASWLSRNMDEDYCWDNIRQPVLFGKGVVDIVKEKGHGNVVFLELSPHPVLQGYINNCGGKSFSLVQRPNPKVPASNTGEHHQLLHGIGGLLTAGFRSIDFAKLCATPDGRRDFVPCKLPAYPYNRSKCWSESAADRSMRLHKKGRPLAGNMYRLSCDTHPDLSGHVIFERPIFPAAGYIDSILQTGALVVKNVKIRRPLVMPARGSEASYVGVVTDDDEWEFRVATSNTFENGYIKLDTIYADGGYSRKNPDFNPDDRKRFDIESKLALSRCHLTGEEFYQAIPPMYGYTDNFTSYIKEIHELPDESSWGGSGYLIKLEIPEDGPDDGYIIHPSILDSIMHATLAAFIDTDTKTFDFTETLLPVSIDQITRWDRGDDKDLAFPIRGTVWTYLTISTWNPSGPCRSDLTVTNSESLVLFTMEGMEFAVAPQEQFTMDECYTTIWQPKIFPAEVILPPSVDVATPPYLRQVLDKLITNAKSNGRRIVRILDLDVSSSLATAVSDLLVSLPQDQIIVDYFVAGESPEDADEKARAMSYSRARPFVLDAEHTGGEPTEGDKGAVYSRTNNPFKTNPKLSMSDLPPEEAEKVAQAMARARQAELDPGIGDYAMVPESFDVLFKKIDASLSPEVVEKLLERLAPLGILLLLQNSTDEEKPEEKPAEQLKDKVEEKVETKIEEKVEGKIEEKLEAKIEEKVEEKSEETLEEKPEEKKPTLAHPAFQKIPEQNISFANLDTGETLIVIRAGIILKEETKSETEVVIHHFTRGTEEELVDIVNKLSEDSEIWILGDDSPIGIGALGIAACIIAEQPDFIVHSVLFENVSLSLQLREEVVHALRRVPSHLEQHMKYSASGDVLVRRLTYHPKNAQPREAPGVSIEVPLTKGQISAYFPPDLKATDVQVSVESFGIDSTSADRPSVAFVGKVTHVGVEVKDVSIMTRVIGMAKHPITDIVVLDQKSITLLPDDVPDSDAVALPIVALVPWLALVEYAPISDTSVVLLHNASTHVGFGAIQLCQRFGAKFFCTVPTLAEGKRLSDELNVDAQAISTSLLVNDVTSAAKTWLSSNEISGFDTMFNLTGSPMGAAVFDLLTAEGQYIHNKSNAVGQVNIPSGAPIVRVIDVPKLVESYPSTVAPRLAKLLTAHISTPFKLQSQPTSVSQLSSLTAPTSTSEVLVATADISKPIDMNTGHLFDPRKSYLLIGGSSELGVRISVWMANRGARYIILTSRRGPKALGKMDKVYLRHLQTMGVHMDIIAADARNAEEMTGVITHAIDTAPVGGIFLMTVVSRDGMFSGMKQESFDEVYFSKVIALHTLLRLVNPAALEFLLLFSTIGSVFGNAGQSAYCASQLYLDRIAEDLPNTTSISLPPISDSGMFKRLLMSSKGRSSSKMAMKIGVTTAQACDFIADSIIRQIPHYVPAIAIKNVPMVFSNCERLLYNHVLPTRFLVKETDNERGTRETPASLLSELLGLAIDQISNDVTLKDYGLDSLGAIRFSKELEGHFGIKVSQLELLGSMTIGLLEEMVASSSKPGGPPSEDDNNVDANFKSVPDMNLADQIAFGEAYMTKASHLQSRIWHSYDQIEGNENTIRAEQMYSHERETHGILATINSPTALDVSRLREAFSEIIQRHGALRTAFFLGSGKLKQCVYPFLDFEVKIVDLKAETDGKQRAHEMALEECKELQLQLEKLPVFKATAFDLGNNTWSFSFITHYIVMDKTSLGLIIRELVALYHDGTESLEPQDMHQSDVSDWLFYKSGHRPELQTQQRKFWTETLADVQPVYLMSQTPSEHALSDLTQVEATIDATTLSLFRGAMREAKATSSEGFFAIYNTLLHSYSSQETMVIGALATQRNIPELANVVGPLTTSLPIKTTVDLNKTFLEHLTSFKADLSKSLQNSDVVYYEGINPGQASQRQNFFRQSFSYDGLNLDAISDLKIENVQVEDIHSLSKFEEGQELLLDVYGRTGRLILRFDNHLVSSEDATNFLDKYVTFVKALCGSPNSKMCDAFNPPAVDPSGDTTTIDATINATTDTETTTDTTTDTETIPDTDTTTDSTDTAVDIIDAAVSDSKES
ncbi:hypothetical protein BDZ94DRAFT_1263481 [Collybia nuda]|uniref:Uncharacterized protein n=1 Tax=Collybia nuda TaxID=64659 RepID=A0A9P5Y384_9AGAR|nr:hypothetical protein BDZ94DRAFT_1263481 [Collybia nuda]